MKYLLVLFIIVFCFRLLTNIFRLFATKHYYRLYKNDCPHINEYSKPIGDLFNKAETQKVEIIESGRNKLYTRKDFISNLLTDKDSKNDIMSTFEQTIGVYQYRIRQNFYPIFWLSFPVYLLNQINIHPNKGLSVFIDVVFWAVGVIAAYFLEKYLDSVVISDSVISYISNLLK